MPPKDKRNSHQKREKKNAVQLGLNQANKSTCLSESDTKSVTTNTGLKIKDLVLIQLEQLKIKNRIKERKHNNEGSS